MQYEHLNRRKWPGTIAKDGDGPLKEQTGQASLNLSTDHTTRIY